MRIGDRVSQGQVLAQVEDREIREQVKQARGLLSRSAQATIRQREADLKFAETSLARSRNLFDRQLLPRQTLDDIEARQQAADGAAGPRARAVRAGEGAARGTAHHAGQHAHPVAGGRVRRQAQRRSRRLRVVQRSASPRSWTSGSCAWWRTSSRRTCAASLPARRPTSTWTRFPARPSRGASPASRRCWIPPRARRRWRSRCPNADYRLKPGMYSRVRLTVAQRDERAGGAAQRAGGRRGQARRLHATTPQAKKAHVPRRRASACRTTSARRSPAGSPRATASSRPGRRRCVTATRSCCPAQGGGPGGGPAAVADRQGGGRPAPVRAAPPATARRAAERPPRAPIDR